MKKGAPLEDGEVVELAGHGYCQTAWLMRRPCFLRLTDRRLTVVVHYALQPDRLITIPVGGLLEVTVAGDWIKLRYRSKNVDDTITVRSPGWSDAGEYDDEPREEDAEELGVDTRGLAEVLATWAHLSWTV